MPDYSFRKPPARPAVVDFPRDQFRPNRSRIVIGIVAFFSLIISPPCFGVDLESVLGVVKNGKTLEISIVVPDQVSEVELRFHSFRNANISNASDISPYDPKKKLKQQAGEEPLREFWYPVVDLAVVTGLEGVARFSQGGEARCLVNGPFWNTSVSLPGELCLRGDQLEHWENSIGIEPPKRRLTRFYLQKRYPIVRGALDCRVELLSERWHGKVELFAIRSGSRQKLAESMVSDSHDQAEEHPNKTVGLHHDELIESLRAILDFTLRCQNTNPQSPGFGGLYLFYDLDAATYRTNYWMWGWGPTVRLLLDASNRSELADRDRSLRLAARQIGESTLRFLWHRPGHPLHQVAFSRWDRNNDFEDGYRKAITIADAHFLAGWAWIPLYETTADRRYLDLTRRLCQVTDDVMDQFKIVPHSYWVDEGTWSDFTLDECGFGLEGFAEIYRVTKEDRYKTIARRYLRQHLDIFEQEDGLWRRTYLRSKDSANPSTRMTRGLGWAMEGLLAAHRLMPDEGYLNRAKRMAQHLLESQLPSGAWAFKFDQPPDKIGFGEKGTALWSYLMYRIYQQTNEERYLNSARVALKWCLTNQYRGPDPDAVGSLVGRSGQSAVGYRKWFDVSCVYTSAFVGLAILEELKIQPIE